MAFAFFSRHFRPMAALIVEAADTATRAALWRIDSNGKIARARAARSQALALAEALADIKAQWSDSDSRGLAAALLTPHVQTAILNLPVDPERPLSPAEMHEMIRWEMEPYLTQMRGQRLGAILIRRGYLKSEDLPRLLSRARESAAAGKPMRLGEIAVAEGYLTATELAACLEQQRAQSRYDDCGIACGWAPFGPERGTGKWRWLAAAMPAALGDEAVAAFAQQGWRLCALYPLVGCAIAGLNGRAAADDAILEHCDGFIAYTRFAHGQVASRRQIYLPDADNLVASALTLCEKDAKRIWLAGCWPDATAAAEALARDLCRPCTLIAAEDAAGEEEIAWSGLKGAAAALL
ncbi:MAG: hypothetical protein N3A66_03300, partial [Planctomycetota bacterium]|nr:hypothetical protein [Planctomycetota bacterium]